MGLCFFGGVYFYINYLLGLLDIVKVKGIFDICIYVIIDGCDINFKLGV